MLLTLSLQLSNGVLDRAVNEFLEGSMKSMWKDTTNLPPHLFSFPMRDNDNANSNTMMGAGMNMGTGMGLGMGTRAGTGSVIPQCLSAVTEVDSRDSVSMVYPFDEITSIYNTFSIESPEPSIADEKRSDSSSIEKEAKSTVSAESLDKATLRKTESTEPVGAGGIAAMAAAAALKKKQKAETSKPIGAGGIAAMAAAAALKKKQNTETSDPVGSGGK